MTGFVLTEMPLTTHTIAQHGHIIIIVIAICCAVVFLFGTKFYVIIKPKKEFARLFLDIPACILVRA